MNSKVLRALQEVGVEILDEIVRICNENSIEYYLIAGSLLGAVRHQGFIPWDDDIDIGMPRDEYIRFKEICKTQLHPKYFLQDIETEKLYFLPYAKIRKNGTCFEEPHLSKIDMHKGIFVDIFPLDNAQKEKSIVQLLQYSIYRKVSMLIWHNAIISSSHKKTLKQKIIVKLSKAFELKKMCILREKIMMLNKNASSTYFINLGSPYSVEKETIKKNKYRPHISVKFEGKYYNAPNEFDHVLTKVYGNYMQLPPEGKRATHNVGRVDFGTNGSEDVSN